MKEAAIIKYTCDHCGYMTIVHGDGIFKENSKNRLKSMKTIAFIIRNIKNAPPVNIGQQRILTIPQYVFFTQTKRKTSKKGSIQKHVVATHATNGI